MPMFSIIQLTLKVITVIFLGLSLSACYETLYLSETTQSVHRNPGFYQFYDNSYLSSYDSDPYYQAPLMSYYQSPLNSYYHREPAQIYSHHCYHYDDNSCYPSRQPRPRYYEEHYYSNPHHHSRHRHYSRHDSQSRKTHYAKSSELRSRYYENNSQSKRAISRQRQINSDRALAQELQNKEIQNAYKETQIASDRALAERLQAQEYANAV